MSDKTDAGKDVRENLDSIENDVLNGLMPFQRATVEHIDHLYREGHKRVLVADEVGLGKTMVARGAIAKIARLRHEENDDLVKVVYVCSNGAIAKQNLSKLRIDKDIELADPSNSRLSMQHLQLAKELCDPNLKRRYVQLIPLTPATSFQLSSGQGTQCERALIFAVLEYDPQMREGNRRRRLKRLLWANRSPEGKRYKGNWDAVVQSQEGELRNVIEKLSEAHADPSGYSYPGDLIKAVKEELEQEDYPYGKILEYLDIHSTYNERKGWPEENRMITSLRHAFSKASMDMMEPDFVIMDEFQRFRSLISDDETEMSILAKRFFANDVRILLLSATPFRMYSTGAESDDEAFGDSGQEFKEVVGFLAGANDGAKQSFREVWSDYSKSLLSLESADNANIVDACLIAKSSAESQMSNFIARTERTSTHELAGFTQIDVDPCPLQVSEDDVMPYFAIRELADAACVPSYLAQPDFVKSCPLPLSFMRDYKLKAELVSNAGSHWDRFDKIAYKYRRALWIDREDIQKYKPLSIKHSRYAKLRDAIFADAPAELLLWVPPSMPYYRASASSPYAKAEHFTKTLIFSSWAMVPPALSSLLSYEAEQRNVATLQRYQRYNDADYRYFKQDDDDEKLSEEANANVLPHGRLSMTGAKATAFSLVYPSPYLASLFDASEVSVRDMSFREVRDEITRRIRSDLSDALGLSRLPAGQRRANVDWYAMATLLLDDKKMSAPGSSFIGSLMGTIESRQEGYPAAAATLKRIYEGYASFDFLNELGGIPDDLAEVLAEAAIGSPAVCALRTYYGNDQGSADLFWPFEFGYAFMTKMNTAAATVAVAVCTEKGQTAAAAHWKHVLSYCCEGNFQAMLDEYWHLVFDGDVLSAHKSIVGQKLGNDKTPSLHKTDSRVEVETYSLFKEAACGKGKRSASKTIMRTSFAAGFMETKGVKAKGENRRSELRAAFNSPFRPFVLVSTSVGQEGLDFHQYCRRIVHWNLPSNPIDFEQREGRINRYKSLAVRQTLADRYEESALGANDAWGELFATADREENKKANAGERKSGLLPFWGVTAGEPCVPIERLVYNYPFSRDEDLYRYLMETTARYRAVLGQPNQEELLGLLQRKLGNTGLVGENFERLFMNLCPFCHPA